MFRCVRFSGNPLVHPGLDAGIGANINGPSLIRVPRWISRPLAKYYLYFAHHRGEHIRLAYADDLGGPWRVYRGGVLSLEDTCCRQHIASPDVHVLPSRQEIVMYFHGGTHEGQRSFRAVSRDGLSFRADTAILGPFYFRVFTCRQAWFAIAKTTDKPGGGVLLRSPDGVSPFQRGPDIIPGQRHVAVLPQGGSLRVFFSRGGDCPERILASTMRLTGDWNSWRPAPPVTVLEPETREEGGHLPLCPSRFGAVDGPVRQLRDPALYEEDGRVYLFYSGAGESNICGAEIIAGLPGPS